MAVEGKYNIKNTGVKRLMREAQELKDPTDEYHAHPLEDNLFEWHFTVRGPPDSDFEGGLYHGRILLPVEYPMQPPNIIMVTPNGRFETNNKICLSISGHHPETWQPSWSIRTALVAIIAFMPTPGNGTIGSLDYTQAERQRLARKSQNWVCPECGKLSDLLPLSNVPKISETTSCTKEDLKNKSVNEEKSAEFDGITTTGQETSPTNVESCPEPSEDNQSSAQSMLTCSSSPRTDQLNNNLVSSYTDSGPNSFLNAVTAVIFVILAFLIYRRLFLL